MALLCLLLKAGQAMSREVHALIVDHQLRAESGKEALLVAERARSLGAIPQILTWEDPKPTQAAARQARHRLLARATQALGADRLFLGHTRDDRVETLIMRQSRTSHMPQRSVMPMVSPSPAWPDGRGIRIARPLINQRRADLRLFLQDQAVEWVEDPSNEDERYERIRVRQFLATNPVDEAALLETADKASHSDQLVLQCALSLLSDAVRVEAWGGLKLRPAVWFKADESVAARAMEIALLSVSGQAELPGPGLCERFLDALRTAESQTGAGAIFADGYLGRDRGAVQGRRDGHDGATSLELSSGETAVFDGCFEITAHQDMRIEPVGKQNADRLYPQVPRPFRASLPAIALNGAEPVSLFSNSQLRILALTQVRMEHLGQIVAKPAESTSELA